MKLTANKLINYIFEGVRTKDLLKLRKLSAQLKYLVDKYMGLGEGSDRTQKIQTI